MALVSRTCITCGAPFTVSEYRLKRGGMAGCFCSRECRRGENHHYKLNPSVKPQSKKQPIVRFCACDCGEQLSFKSAEHGAKFIVGHSHRTYKPYRRLDGYVYIWDPSHPRSRRGRVREHIVIAEAAIGKSLPPRAEVHHFDEVRYNNANDNLVICENNAYHALLHRRKRVLDAGGDPNTQQICAHCKAPKDFSEFHLNRTGRNGRAFICKPCSSVVGAEIYRRKQNYLAEEERKAVMRVRL